MIRLFAAALLGLVAAQAPAFAQTTPPAEENEEAAAAAAATTVPPPPSDTIAPVEGDPDPAAAVPAPVPLAEPEPEPPRGSTPVYGRPRPISPERAAELGLAPRPGTAPATAAPAAATATARPATAPAAPSAATAAAPSPAIPTPAAPTAAAPMPAAPTPAAPAATPAPATANAALPATAPASGPSASRPRSPVDAALASPVPVWVRNGLLVEQGGRALYFFDRDIPDQASRCDSACSRLWPPYYAPAGARPHGRFTITQSDDGKPMWAFNGRPLYRWISDKKRGDAGGDGINGTWALARVSAAEANEVAAYFPMPMTRPWRVPTPEPGR